jgi:aspartyl/asparaginyl beta-hydroxylase (cupin superfamily)
MKKKPWYNYWNPPYKSDEPNYFSSDNFSWAQTVKKYYPQIKRELLDLIEERKGQLFPYYSKAVNTNANNWQTLAFKTWGINVPANLQKCPTVKKLLNEVPQMVSASVNMLMPNSELSLHQGDSDSFYRCHLGISIPATYPELAFEVEGEPKSWEEGEILIFLDAKNHRAWNKSDKPRIIFLFDIIKDEYIEQQNEICFNVRSFLLLQWLDSKIPGFINWPKPVHRLFFYFNKLVLKILFPYQKKKGVILNHS